MARKVTMVLTGDLELNKKLAALTDKQAKEAIRKAARPALQGTLATARSLAPKRTGALGQSIRIRAITRSRTRVGARVTTNSSSSLFRGRTFYGAFQEYGWKTGSRKNQLEQATRRNAKAIRAESRAAGGLSKVGTEFRARQERYFRNEGARRALSGKIPVRKQIAGREFMKQAAQKTRTSALTQYRESIRNYIRSIATK
jgi:HK97 gp10 family phage protein